MRSGGAGIRAVRTRIHYERVRRSSICNEHEIGHVARETVRKGEDAQTKSAEGHMNL